ncbi:MAG: hypothetical protein JWM78_3566 [Verrucomicrobiaceae bacterium]|nr:hypothetical protein [Verrucomicrobiaceae bacterium]
MFSGISDDVVLSTPASFSGPNSILNNSTNTHSNGNIVVDLTSVCVKGSVTSQGTFNEATSVGELKISYNDCEDGYGSKYTGVVRTTIRETDGQKIPTAFDFAFENYAVVNTNPQFLYAFTMAYNGTTVVTEDGGKITAVTNMVVSSSAENYLIKATDFVSTYSPEVPAFNVAADNRVGHVADSNIGYVTVSTDASLATRSYLSGSDTTKIQIDFDSNGGSSHYALDVGGDQSFDAYLGSASVWPFPSDDSNTPPFSYIQPQLTSAANADYHIAISAGDLD